MSWLKPNLTHLVIANINNKRWMNDLDTINKQNIILTNKVKIFNQTKLTLHFHENEIFIYFTVFDDD